MIDHLKQSVTDKLENLERENRRRVLHLNCYYQDEVIDLSHNDYLGLRIDQRWQEQVWRKCRKLPVGSGGSRLLGGEFKIFQEIEQQFAEFKGAPRALFFASGYAANEACLPAIAANLNDGHFFSDQHNHASSIDGFRLARISAERRTIYPHGDIDYLATALHQSTATTKVIVSESLFSMDGDQCNLNALVDLPEQAILLIDEAHSLGVQGERGAGSIADSRIDQQQVISINTCGKALAVSGAFVCAPSWFIDYLINSARPFIYTTAPSPWLAVAVKEAIITIATLDDQRIHLKQIANYLRRELTILGFDIGTSTSHIIPLICKNSLQALQWSKLLAEDKIIVPAIRPPTVANPRLRLSLHAGLTEQHIDRLLDSISKLSRF